MVFWGGASSYGASPLAATQIASNVTIGGLTRGTGVSTSGTAAARAWGGVDWQNTSEATAISGNDYATFTVTANSGYQISYSAISQFNYRRSATGPGSGVLQYQVGGGAFTDITTISYSNNTSAGGSLAAIDLSGIAALQNVPASSTVTFRIVNFGGTSAGGTWYVFDTLNSTANDLEISGTVSAGVTAINGSCGTANGKTLSVAPTANLCSTGTASSVSGSGPWNWSCAGTGGGTTASCSAVKSTASPFTIFHMNDVHARITPHEWIISQHSKTQNGFEAVGGAAYLVGEMLSLTNANPTALVLDGGDISEGNPLGDMNVNVSRDALGNVTDVTLNGSTTGSFGNGGLTNIYTTLANKLKAIPGRGGRGIDALVVGNHDVRDVSYINNMQAMNIASGIPVISANVRDISTHQPHFPATTTVTVNGTKIGIIGYTTPSAVVGASLSSSLEVVQCAWNASSPLTGTSAVNPCHIADYVNDLRNNQNCDVVILLTHDGHSDLVDPTTPVIADTNDAKVPEIAVTGHWHTYSDSVWQPASLNYKTIFTESASYMKYIGELNVNGDGSYVSATQHVLRNSDITPDPDIQAFVNKLQTVYNTANPGHPVDEIVGYTASDLMLDNVMKWWSADEYPWSGNNTAGQWITDAMQWKCAIIFGQCDLAMEAGGGVRADIPSGPVTYKQVYETFPWADDTYYRVNMTGQDIINFIKTTTMDAGFSAAMDVTAVDGIPTSVTINGQALDVNHTYTVGINNYMYDHPPSGYTWTDKAPLTSSVLVRDSLSDYMRQVHPTQAQAYQVGGDRYHLNGEYSGGYRVVVTMLNDNDSKPSYDDAFIRFIGTTPETLARINSKQVPANLVNADGSINASNRLSEQEWYRSFLGFKAGALKPGDIVEVWGKAGFFGGNPEFIDQEGVYANGVEFKIVGHDASLAKPTYVSSINALLNDNYKNHYVQFLANRTGTSTVADQFSQSLSIMDVTGYAAKTLPGSNGNTLLLSGVLTMESYGFRFRCDNATVSTTALPTVTSVTSQINPLPSIVTAPITLSATTSINAPTYYLAPIADSQIESGVPGSNFGTLNYIYLQSSSTSTYGNERGLLKFDLSSIPVNTQITSASLQLWNFKSAGAALPVEVHSTVTDNWIESGTGSVTWNNQPGMGSVLDTQTLASGASNLWYSWNVTNFVKAQLLTDKIASVTLRAVTENSSDATAPSYAFDSKEYGSNAPVLQVNTLATGATVGSVRYFYRYSTDNSNWGGWVQYATVNSGANYSTAFNFPNNYGYYEFYTVATDSLNNSESIPAYAEAAVQYQSFSGQSQSINFTPASQGSAGANVTLAATTNSGLAVSYTSTTPSICTVSGTVVTTIASGVCTIAANQVGDLGYWLPATSSQSFNVTQNSSSSSTQVPLPNWAVLALALGLISIMQQIIKARR